MTGGALRITAVAATLLAAAVFTPAAGADGLPVLGVDVGAKGVTTPTGKVRYVTLPAGPKTVVAQVRRDNGVVLRSKLLAGRFTIPAVAYDGSPSGLSADGRTAVLIRPRVTFPQAQTTLAVLDARRLRVLRTLTLPGDFSFDAISPNGTSLYLIEYESEQDPTRYAVRALNLPTGRLLPKPIVDPREPDEEMRGSPVTRAAGPDGRWAYTLYDGTEHPFVHALDTVGRTARCIDLPALSGRDDLSLLRLRVNTDATLSVLAGASTVQAVDLATFSPIAPASPDAGGRFLPLTIGATVAAVMLAAAAAFAFALRRRRRPALG